jgi:hypothetical protein
MTVSAVIFCAISFAILSYVARFGSAISDFAQRWLTGSTREERGVRLLREWLSPDQLESFDRTRSFVVVGCDSGRRYRISYGVQQNVYEIDQGGGEVTGLCFVPEGYLVAGDVMLSQKISLETNETATLKVARRFAARSGTNAGALISR